MATVTGAAQIRANFSLTHLLAAALFARSTGAAESAGAHDPTCRDEVVAFATGCVVTAVAVLESYASELFVDHAEVFPGLGVEYIDNAGVWQQPILAKFNLASQLGGGKPLERGRYPYQDVDVLVKLRNALIHFKPEWFEESSDHGKLARMLKNRAVLSPFRPGEKLFPRAWASYGTTKWAVTAVVKLVQVFDDRIGLPSDVEPHLARLHI